MENFPWRRAKSISGKGFVSKESSFSGLIAGNRACAALPPPCTRFHSPPPKRLWDANENWMGAPSSIIAIIIVVACFD